MQDRRYSTDGYLSSKIPKRPKKSKQRRKQIQKATKVAYIAGDFCDFYEKFNFLSFCQIQKLPNRPPLTNKNFCSNREIFPCSESIYIMFTWNVYFKIERGDTKYGLKFLIKSSRGSDKANEPSVPGVILSHFALLVQVLRKGVRTDEFEKC